MTLRRAVDSHVYIAIGDGVPYVRIVSIPAILRVLILIASFPNTLLPVK